MLQGGTELRGAVERGGETEGVGREEKRRGEIRREEKRGGEKKKMKGEEKRGKGMERRPSRTSPVSEAATSTCCHRPLPERSVRAAAQPPSRVRYRPAWSRRNAVLNVGQLWVRAASRTAGTSRVFIHLLYLLISSLCSCAWRAALQCAVQDAPVLPRPF